MLLANEKRNENRNSRKNKTNGNFRVKKYNSRNLKITG